MRPYVAASCHPDRKHYGHGLCSSCWSKERYRADPERVRADNRAAYARNAEKRRAAARSAYHANREEMVRRSIAWSKANPDKVRNKRLKRVYGIDSEQYRDHLVGQAGRCLICLMVPQRDLVVDHDHATGRFRGLLCHQCNRAIGHFRDNPRYARAAAQYLEGAA